MALVTSTAATQRKVGATKENRMDPATAQAIALRPFVMFIFIIVIVLPIKWAILKMVKNEKTRAWLLTDITSKKPRGDK